MARGAIPFTLVVVVLLTGHSHAARVTLSGNGTDAAGEL
jgi:hypothetical protein